MIEETKRADWDLTANGYKDLGIYNTMDKKFNTLLYQAIIQDKSDLLLSKITPDTYRVYQKGGV